MRTLARWVAVLTLALMALTVVPLSAHADDDTPKSWRIARYDASVVVAADGSAQVSLDFDFDFSNDPGHGPFIVLPERQRVKDNPDVWRLMEVKPGAVSSATGADTTTVVSHKDGNMIIRVGKRGKRWRGIQNYKINYEVRGLVDPKNQMSGLDEVNWQVIGPGWEVPIVRASASITGPVPAERALCWWGKDNNRSCKASEPGATQTYSTSRLRPGEGFQAVAGYPIGTFTGAEPKYTKRYHVGNMFPLTPVSGIVAGLGSVVGVGLVAMRSRRSARDDVYLGLTPGLAPVAGEQAVVGRGGPAAPVTVQFTPPKGARPGEVGVLQDATADNVDITATIIDLSVRGHFTITDQGEGQWSFARQESDEPLTGPERFALQTLFSRGNVVSTDDLRDPSYHDLQPGIRTRLYDRVTKELHWFKMSPVASQALAILSGVGLILGGAVVGVALGFAAGLGLAGIPFVVAGVTMILLFKKFGRRTADGSAILAQSKGFELYLRTAEAHQIKFEEGIDVFSRYLPYAIVFGVADRWAKLFQQLAAEGIYQADTSWYVGPNPVFYGSSLGRSMDSLGNSLTSAMQSSISASNAQSVGGSGGGSSGFSGGGGFGGGGGGGW